MPVSSCLEILHKFWAGRLEISFCAELCKLYNHSWPWCILHSFFLSYLASITLANYFGFLPKYIQNLTISHHPPPTSILVQVTIILCLNLEPSDPAQTQVRSCQSAQTFWRCPIFLMVRLTESIPWHKSPKGSGPIPFLIAFPSILSFYSNLATLAFFLFFEHSRLVPTWEPLQPSFYLECSVSPSVPPAPPVPPDTHSRYPVG